MRTLGLRKRPSLPGQIALFLSSDPAALRDHDNEANNSSGEETHGCFSKTT